MQTEWGGLGKGVSTETDILANKSTQALQPVSKLISRNEGVAESSESGC